MRKLVTGFVLLSACQSAQRVEPASTVPAGSGPAAQTPTSAGAANAPELGSSLPASSALPSRGQPCGALGCRRYPDAQTAALDILERRPQVVGIGEAHALKVAENVESSTARFERDLLPLFARAGATELVVELLGPAKDCEKPVAAVKEQTRPVVQDQSQGNQNRFVSLGVAARKLNVVPYILEPSCDEYKSVIDPVDGVTRMLELIAKKTEDKLTHFWQRNTAALNAPDAPVGADPSAHLVVAYGGAMHNDVSSPPDGQNFRYGAHLVQLTGGHYIELDLIVPEYIKDSEVWRALPWYNAYAALPKTNEVTLFQPAEFSYALIFAPSAAQATAAASGSALPGPSSSN
jgi:hypothetical protein